MKNNENKLMLPELLILRSVLIQHVVKLNKEAEEVTNADEVACIKALANVNAGTILKLSRLIRKAKTEGE